MKWHILAESSDPDTGAAITLQIHPLVSSGLCKSGFCAGLHLRANYILVSFDEYHPDKRYTWLPFPAAQCNPAVQQCNTLRGQRSEKLCSKDPKLTLEWKIKIRDCGRDCLVKAPVTHVNATRRKSGSKSQSKGSNAGLLLNPVINCPFWNNLSVRRTHMFCLFWISFPRIPQKRKEKTKKNQLESMPIIFWLSQSVLTFLIFSQDQMYELQLWFSSVQKTQ